MGYQKNFFKLMRDCAVYFTNTDTGLVSDADYSDFSNRVSVFNNLVKFVESGTFTTSESEKFICKYWGRDSSYICDLWNETHKKKSESTVRCQMKVLSDKLYELFDLDEDILFDVFMTIDSDYKNRLGYINDVCIYGSFGDIDFKNMFSYTLAEYLEDTDFDGDFELEACEEELELLRLICRDNLLALFESCDKAKLSYLVERMRAPLFVSGSEAVTVDGKVHHIHHLELNEFKLSFCKAFRNVGTETENPSSSESCHVDDSSLYGVAGSHFGSSEGGLKNPNLSDADYSVKNQSRFGAE